MVPYAIYQHHEWRKIKGGNQKRQQHANAIYISEEQHQSTHNADGNYDSFKVTWRL
jgi:hypothetical protein